MKNRVAFYATHLEAKPHEHIVRAIVQQLVNAGAITPSDTVRNGWDFGPHLEDALGVQADSKGWATVRAYDPAANVLMGMIVHGDEAARSHFIITVHGASMDDAGTFRPTPLLTNIARTCGPGVEFDVMTFYM